MLIKNEFDFWRNKLDTYTQVIDDEEIIYLTKIPKTTNWTLTKRLSEDIKISVNCLFNENGKSYNFQFCGKNNFKYHYMDSAEHIISLYNFVIENFEKDISELQKYLKSCNEHKKSIEQADIKVSAEKLMKESDYEWKLNKNILQIKLKCSRILEIKLSNKAITQFQKQNDNNNFVEVITALDTQLKNIPFLVNIDNSIRKW